MRTKASARAVRARRNLRRCGTARRPRRPSGRDFIFVEDTCRAIDTILHAPAEKVEGEVFNVGSGMHRTILSLANDVAQAMCMDKNCYINIDDRPGQVMRHTADASKIERVLGFRPEVSWEQGLRRTIDWYSANENWWRNQLMMREIPIISSAGKRELH